MSAQPTERLQQVVGEGYRLLEPAQKYTRAFCTDEEITIAETIRAFVNKELMPYRHINGKRRPTTRFRRCEFIRTLE